MVQMTGSSGCGVGFGEGVAGVVVAGSGGQTNWQCGPLRPTHDPSGHCRASIVHATGPVDVPTSSGSGIALRIPRKPVIAKSGTRKSAAIWAWNQCIWIEDEGEGGRLTLIHQSLGP
jgi:hypothetical protein